ncbi:SGNH/GDSL hydrolase family protein [Ruminococcus sp. Marseille-P6503]|uniref:SGNH/GDSL hydrolase family protein n=1 Tax=Ruminococcus sp. Marseille-P6503 TaxID=2364796 RepID=UPI001FA94373|nr:SGNH/GDSL hydrolase family protein [Ruminococcus sp. Marseille-P6503]
MKRSALLLTLIAGVLVFTACGSGGQKEEENEQMSYPVLDSSNVKLLGRTHLADDTLYLAFSGTGAEFTYTGSKLEAQFVGDANAGSSDGEARMAVYVNGERTLDFMMDEKEKSVVLFESDKEESADIKIVKLSECAMSNVGIKNIDLNGGSIKPAEEKERKIEFIGDSITCGYGVDDEDPSHSFSTATEDCTKAYAYKTAQKLDADYSLVSISGYGIISGYTSDPEKISGNQTIPPYYEKLGFCYSAYANGEKPSDIAWDFGKFTPDCIVINLGTNDASYCNTTEKKDTFRDSYKEFLKTVRKNNPDAKIFCTLGIMGQTMYPSIEEAVYYYTKETGDENIVCVQFENQQQADGLAADYHPTEATHEKASDLLAEAIKNEMGWS